MLKKENRLKNSKEINLVFQKGRSRFNDFLGFKYIDNKKNINRFAIIIGKKISKKAVVRNKLKRIIKKIIIQENKLLKSGFDCVFIILPNILNKEEEEIKNGIIKNLKNLQLYV